MLERDIDQCEATKREYDFKAERAKQTPEQIQESRQVVFDQTMDANKTGIVDCAGKLKDPKTGRVKDCPKRLMLVWMYRCWFCGRWLCPGCARAHFGDR